jgi:hypothetical protein
MAAALLLAIVLGACGDDDDDDAPRDAAVDAAHDAAPDAAPDAGMQPWACACEPEEDCDACFDRIGVCCYDDPTLGDQVSRLAALCARTGTCSACCNECAEKSCEEIVAGGCPAADPP